VLERFSLTDRKKQLVRSLSKGLRQRLGLAQALVHNPEVVILDEPTIGIDPKQVIEVRDFVKSLREKHTVLFSSHILSEVELICDRVVIIHKGRVVASGTPEHLSKQMRPGVHLYVAVGGRSKAEMKGMLKRIKGVDDIREQGEGFLLSSTNNDDIRAEVTALIAEHRLALLEMRPLELTLEDIFLNLVEKG
jgi:ABC-2 type transport system ATP-binding protein